MCKGIAILINDKDILMNEKNNSHSELGNEDKYLKVNVIYDDRNDKGYRIEVDDHGCIQDEFYKKQGYIDNKGNIISSYVKRLTEFCEENEHKFFKLFSKNLQSATIKGDQSNYSAIIKGDQSNCSAMIEGDQSNNSATIKGDQSNYSAIIKGDQSNNSAMIEGDQSNNSATIEGYQSNNSATIKGYQSNNSATIKGYQSNNSATIKGDILIYNMKHGDKDFQILLDEFSKIYENDRRKATLINFVKWIQDKKTRP